MFSYEFQHSRISPEILSAFPWAFPEVISSGASLAIILSEIPLVFSLIRSGKFFYRNWDYWQLLWQFLQWLSKILPLFRKKMFQCITGEVYKLTDEISMKFPKKSWGNLKKYLKSMLNSCSEQVFKESPEQIIEWIHKKASRAIPYEESEKLPKISNETLKKWQILQEFLRLFLQYSTWNSLRNFSGIFFKSFSDNLFWNASGNASSFFMRNSSTVF